MLWALQYISVAAAFALPWCIGGLVRFHKSGDRKKFTATLAIGIACVAVIAFAVLLAFSAIGAK